VVVGGDGLGWVRQELKRKHGLVSENLDERRKEIPWSNLFHRHHVEAGQGGWVNVVTM
jgi:hypothetical protein